MVSRLRASTQPFGVLPYQCRTIYICSDQAILLCKRRSKTYYRAQNTALFCPANCELNNCLRSLSLRLYTSLPGPHHPPSLLRHYEMVSRSLPILALALSCIGTSSAFSFDPTQPTSCDSVEITWSGALLFWVPWNSF